MSDDKLKGRFVEQLIYGNPVRPFSTTDDGRVVSELRQSREQAAAAQEQLLAQQRATTALLLQQHNSQNIVPQNQVNQEALWGALGGLAAGMEQMNNNQETASGALYSIEETSRSGFQGLQRGIGALARVAQQGNQTQAAILANQIESLDQADELNEEVGEINDNTRELVEVFKDASGRINQGLQQIHADNAQALQVRKDALALAEKSAIEVKSNQQKALILAQKKAADDLNYQHFASQKMDETLRDGKNLIATGAFTNDLLRQVVQLGGNAQNHLRALQQQEAELVKLGEQGNAQNVEVISRLQRMIELGEIAQDRVDRKLSIIAGNSEIANTKLEKLIDLGERFIDWQQQIIVQNGMLVRIGIQNTEIGLAQLKQNVRSNDTLDRIKNEQENSNRVLIGQGKIANYRLDSIIQNLLNLQGGVINLQELVIDFQKAMEVGFQGLNQTIAAGSKAVSFEIALTRAAIVTELQSAERTVVAVGNRVETAVERGNVLLEKLVGLTSESHANEARQYFNEGKVFLSRSETENDLIRALKRFKKGVKKQSTSLENHLGFAITAELLGNDDDAKESYRVSGLLAGDKQKEIASEAYERMAGICIRQGKFDEALSHIQRAIEKNHENLQAKYIEAKLLALLGNSAAALKALEKLVAEDEKFVFGVQFEPDFRELPAEGLIKFYQGIWQASKFRPPGVLFHIFKCLIELNEDEISSDIFCYLFRRASEFLNSQGVGANQLIALHSPHLLGKVAAFIEKDILMMTNKPCYHMIALLFKLKAPTELIIAIIRHLLENDPDLVEVEDDRREVKWRFWHSLKRAFPQFKALKNSLQRTVPKNIQWLFI